MGFLLMLTDDIEDGTRVLCEHHWTQTGTLWNSLIQSELVRETRTNTDLLISARKVGLNPLQSCR